MLEELAKESLHNMPNTANNKQSDLGTYVRSTFLAISTRVNLQ
jgi:hypothetical protein